jgi:excisionase family DNA binding protein
MNIQEQVASDIDFIKRALTANKRVLNISEASQYLGFSVSYIYKLTSSGVLPYSKPNGKTIFFDREKLDVWLLSNNNSSNDEKESAASTFISQSRV